MILLRALPYTFAYAALTGASEIGNWAIGLGLALGLVTISARLRRQPPTADRAPFWLGLPRLLWGAAQSIARGSWQMLEVLVGRHDWRHVGFVSTPSVARTETGLAVLALIRSASPGSIAAETDGEAHTILFNVIDARNPEAERAAVAAFYDRYQTPSVP